ncbi:class I SAM-dependent methyltransferase [archaeon]|nr:class I SAM-dependent methyltransferase [archaeon]
MSLKEIEKMYSFHSKFYDITRPFFVWNRKKAIGKLELKEGSKILVVGCGTGYGFDRILEKIGKTGKIIGVDYSKDMLENARQKFGNIDNVELIQADAAKYKPEQVDAVFYSYSITMIPEWQKSLRNSWEALKKGGALVIVDFSEIQVPLLKHILNWNLRKHGVNNHLPLQKELRKYFEELNYKEYFLGYNFIAKAIKN